MMVITLLMIVRMMMCSSSGDGDHVGDDADDDDSVGDDVGDDADCEIVLMIHQCSPKTPQESPIASQEFPSFPKVCL